MSKEKALSIIDELLTILDRADNKSSCTQQHEHSNQCPHSKAAKKSCPSESKPNTQEQDNFDWKYLTDVKDSFAGKTFRVTNDIKLLEQEWKKSDLGPNDDLKVFCGCIGLCIQVEEDDNTLQLRWGNMDTCWMPSKACAPANELKPTIPCQEADWLPPPGLEQYHEDEKNENKPNESSSLSSEPENLFESVEDDGVKKGKIVQVTRDVSKLEKAWKDSELGPNDDLKPYCGVIGQIMDIEEDDDTIQIRWGNLDTCWIPVKALQPAEGKQPTVPNLAADWLTPEGIHEEEDNSNVEQTNATDEYYKQKQAESENQ